MRNGARRLEDGGPATPLSAGLGLLAAFEAALGMIPQPTLVTDLAGRILHANTLAEKMLDRDRTNVQRALVQAARGERQDIAWRLTPLGGALRPSGYIAVLELVEAPKRANASHQAAARRWKLTARQAEVIDLVAGGATNAAVAEALGIKERTVEFHLSGIFDKAGVDNRATLIARLLVF